jgi:hypothetical protein
MDTTEKGLRAVEREMDSKMTPPDSGEREVSANKLARV